ncbi:disease resistance protein RPV1-like [Cornus florida]|uniref:disease resistance protein RPV1-like n=1 Tax=Cornus florida TaxID=4283 RepID=UPI0028996B60|nr:disease resistance protein RPV1-like [Cornus florida]
MESLRELDLEGTVITNLPPSIVHLNRLYRLDVIDCKMLENLPSNIGEIKSLQYLYLNETAIKDLPPSIEQLEGLVQLALSDCKILGSLPSNIGRMKSLRELLLNGTAIKDLPPSVEQLKCLDKLDLTNCKMLGSLPSDIGGMTSLNELFLNGTVIKDLPPSVEQLKGLYKLDLTDCKMLGSLPSNIGEMKSLKELCLGGSGIKKLPSSISLADLGELDWSNCNLDEESILNLPQSSQDLNLSGNNFVSLPASFTQLTRLYSLRLDDCLSLQTLELLPSSIHSVFAKDCVSLERYSIPNGAYIFELNFVETHKLVENHGNKKPNVYYSENPLQEIGGSILLPGNEIPSGFCRIKYES